MLGRKSREISRLQQRVDQLQENEPYLPLAQEIAVRLDEEISNLEGPQIEERYTDILASLSDEARQQKFSELFAALPAEQRHAMLLSTFSDEELGQAIAKERQALVDAQLHKSALEQIAEKAVQYGFVDLGDIPIHTRMIVGLHDFRDFEDYDTPKELLAHCDADRVLSLIALDKANLRLLSDNIEGYYPTATDTLALNQVTQLGAVSSASEGMDFDPYIYFGSHLGSHHAGRYETVNLNANFSNSYKLDLLVGRVLLDGIEVMGSNMTRFPGS